MISNTQALLTPYTRIIQLGTIKPSSKFTVPALTIGLFALLILAATHTVTYNVALIHMSSQQEIQQSVTYHQPITSTMNASQALIRVNQADVSQYATQIEHDQWWASACSAASLTEVIDSYGYSYRITDILKVESNLGAITPESGLQYPEGIDQAALRFGFLTNTLNNPTLDQVIATANNGQPVIVNFPPDAWAGGHFLVVRGGTAATVNLADSSTLNKGAGLGTVSRDYFLKYWRGFAKVLSPSKYVITRKPTITASVDCLNTWRILAR